MSDRRKEKQGQIAPALLVVLRILILGALGISAYLAWTSLSGKAVAGCGPDSGCDKVLHSQWGYWFGVPVSILALAVYLAVLALSFGMGARRDAAGQRKLWPGLLITAILMIGAAIWFTGVQALAIHSFCPFCMTAHGLGVLAALIILFNAPIRAVPERPWQQEKQVYVPPRAARNCIVVAIVALALLAGGQTLHRQKLFVVESVPERVTRPVATNALVRSNVATSAPVAVVTQAMVKPVVLTNLAGGNVVDHRFQVYRGMFQFDLREDPIIGSSEAPYAMLSLFDYTCHHCRATHPLLVQAQRTFGNRLAIASLPMPLDSSCNYTVRRTPLAHSNACFYARLGLTVWRASKEKHAAFDEFLFTGEKPPPLEAAFKYARDLVGAEKFEQALRDPWVGQELARSISIYATNYFHIRNGSMPQIMINTNLTAGSLGTEQDLLGVIGKQLGLRPGQ